MSDYEHHLAALRSNKESFEEAIFENSSWYLGPRVQEVLPSEGSELRETLDSLKIYNEEKVEEGEKTKQIADDKKLIFSSFKDNEESKLEEVLSKEELLSYFSGRFKQEKLVKNCRVLFLVSISGDEQSTFKQFSDSDLGSLFNKMNSSFKLQDDQQMSLILSHKIHNMVEFDKALSVDGKQEFEALNSLIFHLRPEFVITYGGMSTNFLSRKKDKLASIHGKFLKSTITFGKSSFSFSQVPLFHPHLLLINPSMKQTTWTDMKKVIEALGN